MDDHVASLSQKNLKVKLKSDLIRDGITANFQYDFKWKFDFHKIVKFSVWLAQSETAYLKLSGERQVNHGLPSKAKAKMPRYEHIDRLKASANYKTENDIHLGIKLNFEQ